MSEKFQTEKIRKRDGSVTSFDVEKIKQAIMAAAQSVGENKEKISAEITDAVLKRIQEKFSSSKVPAVEEVQDIVEHVLVDKNYPKIAKAYIVYRHERSKLREQEDDFVSLLPHRISHVVKRNGEVTEFNQEKITVAIYKSAGSLGIHDRPLCEKLSNEVTWYLSQTYSHQDPPHIEDIQDIVERVLIRRNHPHIAKAYILYRKNRSAMRVQKQETQREIIPYKKLWQTLHFNAENSCYRVDQLNEHVRSGTLPDLIAKAEKSYHEDVQHCAQQIAEKQGKVRMVIIAGPSSSGKTTTTIKLAEHLQKEGFELVALNVDNYYHNVECHPQDEFGDYDYETPEAIDLPLINRHLKELLEGQTIESPHFDFKTGKRQEKTTPITLKENQIVLIDTLHGLYDGLSSSVENHFKFKVYVETFSQIKDLDGQFVRWTDTRLLRRMVRDKAQRSCSPRNTLEHWHYVRRSELKHIIPYIPKVDYIVNGSLCYELPILKKYLFEYVRQFAQDYENQPKRHDAFLRASRLEKLLQSIADIENDSCIPENSLLREFIGGSIYKY